MFDGGSLIYIIVVLASLSLVQSSRFLFHHISVNLFSLCLASDSPHQQTSNLKRSGPPSYRFDNTTVSICKRPANANQATSPLHGLNAFVHNTFTHKQNPAIIRPFAQGSRPRLWRSSIMEGAQPRLAFSTVGRMLFTSAWLLPSPAMGVSNTITTGMGPVNILSKRADDNDGPTTAQERSGIGIVTFVTSIATALIIFAVQISLFALLRNKLARILYVSCDRFCILFQC